MADIFDTRFKDKEIELSNNRAVVGDDVNLTAKDETLKKILIGAGWDINAFDADALDLDISVLLLNKDNTTREDQEFVFYNNTEAYGGAVTHNGDSRTGAGDGDDESISVDLQGVPFDVVKFLLVISIYKGVEKGQTMDMVRNAYIRIVNAENNIELVRYELTDVLNDKTESAMIAAAVNREGPKWHFVPMAEFVEGGLAEVATRHGMIIAQQ
ncbi:MAG: TerD family protein [Alphaproteobacteria bacterium]|nr:TerD family protein [Alphaproteobacteria bacterium]